MLYIRFLSAKKFWAPLPILHVLPASSSTLELDPKHAALEGHGL